MITYRCWHKRRPARFFGDTYDHIRDGWFLFGILPLYVRDRTERPVGAR